MSDIANKDKVTTVVVLKPNSPTAEQLTSFFSSLPNIEIIQVDTPSEAIQAAIQTQPCIILLSIIDTAQVANVMALLKGIYPHAKVGRLKSMVISKIKNGQIRTACQKLMVSEYIEEPIPARTLQFKANLQIKAIDAIKKKDAELKLQAEKIEIKQGELAKAKELYAADAKMKPATNNPHDAFTFKGCKVKKTDNKTSFDLGGPDPESGDWKEHKSEETGKTQWRWVPNDPAEAEKIGGEKGKDGWTADGEKPTFDAIKKKWSFSGPKPSLAYKKDGKNLTTKAQVNEKGELEVEEDSPQAEENVKKSLEKMAKRSEIKAEKKIEKNKAEPDAQVEKKDAKDKTKDSAEDKLAKMRNMIGDDEDDHKGDPKSPKLKTPPKKDGEVAKSKSFEKDDKQVPLNDKIDKEKTVDKKSKLDSLKENLADDKEGEVKSNISDLNQFKKESPKGINNKVGDSTDAEKPAAFNNKLEAEKEIANKKDPKLKSKKSIGDIKGKFDDSDDDEATTEEKEEKNKSEFIEKKAEFNNKLDKGPKEEAGKFNNKLEPEEETGKKKDPKLKNRKKIESKDKLDALKKSLQDEIQNEMNSPAAEKLDPKEKEKLEKELGVKQGTLSDDALAKKAKAARLKNLAKQLKDAEDGFDPFAEDEEGSNKGFNPRIISKNEEDKKKPALEATQETRKSTLRAHDSDQSEEEVDWRGIKSKEKKSSTQNEAGKSIEAFFIDVKEIKVDQPAWERTENYYVCIGGATKYRGFDNLSSLLPLWVYKGEIKPELLEKQSQWKFLGEVAKKFEALSDVPLEVQDFLNQINDTIKNNLKEDKEEENKQKLVEKKSKLEDLKKQFQDSDNEEPSEDEKNQPGFDLGKFKEDKKAKIAAELAELQKEIDQAQAEEKAREEARNSAIAKASNENTKATTSSQLSKKVKSNEAADFLKKRKEKSVGSKHLELEKKRAEQINGTGPTPSKKIGDIIGLNLVISDALFDGKNLITRPEKIINVLLDHFTSSRATLLTYVSENNGKVLACSDDTYTVGSELDLTTLPKEKQMNIIIKKNSTAFAYLLVEMVNDREDYSERDKTILETMAQSLADYWESQNKLNQGEKAA